MGGIGLFEKNVPKKDMLEGVAAAYKVVHGGEATDVAD